jgi:hypothetical protein
MVLFQTNIAFAGVLLTAGFPPESNWEGVGVFSHSCKLSHPLRQGGGNVENNDTNAERTTTYLQGGCSYGRADLLCGGRGVV